MNNIIFNKSEWIKLIFLLADTQQWLDELNQQAFNQVPAENKKKLFRKTYRLGIWAMAHIAERHYYKIARHAGTGKFTVRLTAILQYPGWPYPVTLYKDSTRYPVSLCYLTFL